MGRAIKDRKCIIQENKHVLENLFSLEPTNGLHFLLMDQAEPRIGIEDILFYNDHSIKHKKFQLLGIKLHYCMTRNEASLMEQLQISIIAVKMK